MAVNLEFHLEATYQEILEHFGFYLMTSFMAMHIYFVKQELVTVSKLPLKGLLTVIFVSVIYIIYKLRSLKNLNLK